MAEPAEKRRGIGVELAGVRKVYNGQPVLRGVDLVGDAPDMAGEVAERAIG